MRHLCFASSVAVGLALSFCVPVRGQFQEPTKDELQMTADAKTPGANALYLTLSDEQDNSIGTRIYYERVKVLTEKGKEKATLRFSHDPNTKYEVTGRTIHKDGTVIPLTDQPSDLVEFKTKGLQLNSLVFTLPSVEVGSILEYRVKFKYPNFAPFPSWYIQQDMFVRNAHYVFKTGALGVSGVTYVERLDGSTKVQNNQKGLYTLDLTDVAALPNEDWMPPLNTFKWRVTFFRTDFKTSEEFWSVMGRGWANFAQEYTNPTGTLKKAVADMVAPGDSETVKAQKIYAAVMKLENTDLTREKTKVERKKEKIRDIHNAQDVWRDQSGNGDEIALLFVALCRAVGLRVAPMVVADRSHALFDGSVLNGSQLDDYLAVAQLDGKRVYLDPGQKMCPFGTLHWKHSLATGFLVGETNSSIDTTPALSYKASNITRIADLTLDEDGDVKGSIRIVLQGQTALHWRQIALRNDEDEVKKQFNEWMRGYLPEGVQGEFDHFLGLTDYGTSLMATVKVTGSLGTVTGKHFFLPGLFFEVKSKHPFVAQDKRTIPVDVQYPKVEQDDVTYRLPAGYVVEGDQKPTLIYWPDHAKLTISTTALPDGVQVVRNLVYNYTILAPKEYELLHDFFLKVAAADQQEITLSKSATSPGGN
jgi:hypothetical protein